MLVRQIPDGVYSVFSCEIASSEVTTELLLERRYIRAILLAILTAKFHQFVIGARVSNSYLYLIIMLIGVLMSLLMVLVLKASTLVAGRS